MPRPRIGLSLDTGKPDEFRRTYEIAADYADAIIDSGGLPVLLPHTPDPALQRELLADLDGLIIPGGDDLDASLWNEKQHPTSSQMDPLRQTCEMAFLKLAQDHALPTLGICLGCQMMNVQRGGSLYQSLTEAFPESPVHHAKIIDPAKYNSSFHSIMLRPGTLIHAIFGRDDIQANSRHRQGLHDIGRGLVASAFAPDGILEAIEDPSKTFWLGVQWHPENLRDSSHIKLFQALVQAACNRNRTETTLRAAAT